MSLVKTKNEQKFLKKHVYAIHSSNNITLLQRKIYNALLFNASYLMNDQKRYTINLRDLSDLIDYNSNDHKNLKKSIRELTITPIDWNIIGEDSIDEIIENTTAYLAGVQFKGGVCIYEYADTLKDFLLKPAIYGKIYIQIQSKFKTSSGIALYENCNRYKELGFTPWLTLEILGKLLGFEPTKLEYKRIKERFINRAVNEVNAHSDINVSLKESKISKKVQKVKFLIEKNDNNIKNIQYSNALEKDEIQLIEQLNQYGFTSKDSVNLVKEYGIEKIVKSINYVTSKSTFKEGKVKSVSGYILKTLKDDYKADINSQKVIFDVKRKKQEEILKDQKLKEQQDSDYSKYLEFINKKIKDSLGIIALTEISRKFKETYQASCQPIMAKWANDYENGQFKHRIINAQFNNYLIENYLPEDIELESKEQYIKNIQKNSVYAIENE